MRKKRRKGTNGTQKKERVISETQRDASTAHVCVQ